MTLISLLLLKHLPFRAALDWTLSNLVALQHRHLLPYDLWTRNDDPDEPPAFELPPRVRQLSLV